MIKNFLGWLFGTTGGALIAAAMAAYMTRTEFESLRGAAASGWESVWLFLSARATPNWLILVTLAYMFLGMAIYLSERRRTNRLEQQLKDATAPRPEAQPAAFQPSDRQTEILRVFLAEQNATQSLSAKTVAERLGVNQHLVLVDLEALYDEGWLLDMIVMMVGRSFYLSPLGRRESLHLLG